MCSYFMIFLYIHFPFINFKTLSKKIRGLFIYSTQVGNDITHIKPLLVWNAG